MILTLSRVVLIMIRRERNMAIENAFVTKRFELDL